ncbi:agrin [Drosophila teissieri]|uniref:agrin n=1 Tax=Drosophila teissieri TaxID=7243 RepID=UPI001CB9E104|nr:agrin [Drosophila teissieri]
MKFLTLLAVLGLLIALFAGSTEGSYCPCDLKTKGTEVCGSNGVTFKNRCEFECSQRDYKKLGRTLNIKNEGPCSSTI